MKLYVYVYTHYMYMCILFNYTHTYTYMCIYIHIHMLCIHQLLFPYRLLQIIEYNFLCYTVGLCWLSILYILVYIH